jgi:DeoR family fructose operon transcriptional repressor
MYARERQEEIARLARQQGRVEVAALAEAFGITPETVRRDLTRLERRGVLRRTHGGALPVERLGFEPGVVERSKVRNAEKQRIGAAAATYLPAEGTVLIDAGTTTACLADALTPEVDLTFVTNALPIALQLMTRPRCTVLMVGGRVRGQTLAQVDSWALRALADVHVDVAFIATNGVSLEHGLTTPDLAEAEVKRTMMRSAARVVLLADSSKIGQRHFARFGDIEQVDVFVTDTDLDTRTAKDLTTLGTEVVRV